MWKNNLQVEAQGEVVLFIFLYETFLWTKEKTNIDWDFTAESTDDGRVDFLFHLYFKFGSILLFLCKNDSVNKSESMPWKVEENMGKIISHFLLWYLSSCLQGNESVIEIYLYAVSFSEGKV